MHTLMEGSTYVAPEVLTVSEAATECRVSAWTIRRWINEGALEHVRLPSGGIRVPVAALSAMQVLPTNPRPGQLKRDQRGRRP